MQNDTDTSNFDKLINTYPELKKYLEDINQQHENQINILNNTIEKVNQQLEENHLNNSKLIHELRNEVTILKSTAQLLEQNNSIVKDMKHWSQVKDSIDIHEKFLYEHSICNHGDKIHPELGDLEAFVLKEMDTYQPLAEQHNITMSFHITDEAKTYFKSYLFDKVKMKHVISNIIRNAFDASSDNGVIDVNCSTDHNFIYISISNNGNQIPEDVLSDIFDPYVTYKSTGTGLGLPIAKKIILAHNGTISVMSSSDKTDFTIHLPVKLDV